MGWGWGDGGESEGERERGEKRREKRENRGKVMARPRGSGGREMFCDIRSQRREREQIGMVRMVGEWWCTMRERDKQTDTHTHTHGEREREREGREK